jgi:hypothetical protein
MTMPTRSFFIFSMKAVSGMMRSMPGRSGPAKDEAAIDHDPFALALRPIAVERGVHADLADAAERQKNEIFLAFRHVGQSF